MQVSKYTSQPRSSSRGSGSFFSLQVILEQKVRFALISLPFQEFAVKMNNLPIRFTLRLQGNQLNYRSAIALALTQNQSDLAAAVAVELTERLTQDISPMFAKVQLTAPAWIEFTLTQKAMQQWLKECFFSVAPRSLRESPQWTTMSFPKYTHDRCCRIRQIAAAEEILSDHSQLGDLSLSQLNLLQASDWRLIYQLVHTLDQLESANASRPLAKLANDLSQVFDDFYRYCQIFNQKQPNFPDIAMIRLHLIAITQGLLLKLVD